MSMGQRVNPHTIRIMGRIIKDWDTKWYKESPYTDCRVDDDSQKNKRQNYRERTRRIKNICKRNRKKSVNKMSKRDWQKRVICG